MNGTEQSGKNVFLHYLNLEYRKTIHVDKFFNTKVLAKLIGKINYFAILFCKDYCSLPYSALIEDDLVSNIFLKNNYSVFFEKGIIRASIREESPEEFLEKKIIQYNSDPELYGYYKSNALGKLKLHNIPIQRRDIEVGKSIRSKWVNELEDYAHQTVWHSVLIDKKDKRLGEKLHTIPDIILDQGKGMIWPLVKRLLDEPSSIQNNRVREVLHTLYFSTYVEDKETVIITELPFTSNDFQLDFYKGKNYSFKVFDSLLMRLDINNELFSLESDELLLLKESPEFHSLYQFYHNLFGNLKTISAAVEALNEIDRRFEFFKIKRLNQAKKGIDKVMFVLNHLSDSLQNFSSIIDTTNKYFQVDRPVNSMGNLPSPRKFDLAILTALYDDELEKIIEVIGENWEHGEIIKDSTKVYSTCEVTTNNGKKIKIIVTHQHNTGMVEAAIFSTEIITRYEPRYLIMAGVLAGKPQHSDELATESVQESIIKRISKKVINRSYSNKKKKPEELGLGDIIVGTKLFTYEKGKHTITGFEKELDDCDIDGKLIQQIQLNKTNILNKVKDDLKAKGNKSQNADNLKVHISPIACSFSVVNIPGHFKEKVEPIDRKTKGLEMESYGVAKACKIGNNGKTKALIIKSIMDRTQDKNDKYKSLAALTSALFVKHLINILDFNE